MCICIEVDVEEEGEKKETLYLNSLVDLMHLLSVSVRKSMRGAFLMNGEGEKRVRKIKQRTEYK